MSEEGKELKGVLFGILGFITMPIWLPVIILWELIKWVWKILESETFWGVIVVFVIGLIFYTNIPNIQKHLPIFNKTNLTEQEPVNINQNSKFNFLKSLDGAYEYGAKSLQNKEFANEIKELMGVNNFNRMASSWNVQSAMTYKNGIYISQACEQANCSNVYFIIIYDFNNQNLVVGTSINNIKNIYKQKDIKFDESILSDWKN
jgi:hypothetical protein